MELLAILFVYVIGCVVIGCVEMNKTPEQREEENIVRRMRP